MICSSVVSRLSNTPYAHAKNSRAQKLTFSSQAKEYLAYLGDYRHCFETGSEAAAKML